MTKVEKSALVKYSAIQMYELVNDIESYPKFLPWCSGTRILTKQENIIEAEIQISKVGFNKSFSTRNTYDGAGKLVMTLIEGPFSSLNGVWKFMPLRDDASKISVNLEFEMNGKLANIAFGNVFNQICNTMLNSFTERAKQIYG